MPLETGLLKPRQGQFPGDRCLHLGRHPAAARRIRSSIETLEKHLAHQPFMGRTGAIPGTREAIPYPSHRLVDQVNEDSVFILAVERTARQWPPAEDEGD